jgi:hypothetical protein
MQTDLHPAMRIHSPAEAERIRRRLVVRAGEKPPLRVICEGFWLALHDWRARQDETGDAA